MGSVSGNVEERNSYESFDSHVPWLPTLASITSLGNRTVSFSQRLLDPANRNKTLSCGKAATVDGLCQEQGGASGVGSWPRGGNGLHPRKASCTPPGAGAAAALDGIGDSRWWW